jgi:hypothetical protein
MLRAFLDHARGDRLYAAWLLFATTGMRRGEVAGLRLARRRPGGRPRLAAAAPCRRELRGPRLGTHDGQGPPLAGSRPGHGGGPTPAPRTPGRGASGRGAALAGLRPRVHLAGRSTRPPAAVLHLVRAARPSSRPPEDQTARRSPQLRLGRPRRRHPRQGGQRAARPRQHRHHHGHLQPRAPRPGRRGRRHRGEADPGRRRPRAGASR